MKRAPRTPRKAVCLELNVQVIAAAKKHAYIHGTSVTALVDQLIRREVGLPNVLKDKVQP